MLLSKAPFVLLIVALCGCQAPSVDVPGWRVPAAAELKALVTERSLRDPEQPPPQTEVRGDFNRDGKQDRVLFLISEDGVRFAPYILDGAGAPPEALDRGDSRARMSRYSLSSLPAGAIHGMCVEEAADLSDCDRSRGLKGQAIVFFEVDNGGVLYLWSGSHYAPWPMRRDPYKVSRARPADEHPLARQPVHVKLQPMELNEELPTFEPHPTPTA